MVEPWGSNGVVNFVGAAQVKAKVKARYEAQHLDFEFLLIYNSVVFGLKPCGIISGPKSYAKDHPMSILWNCREKPPTKS